MANYKLEEVKALLAKGKVVALTGAGISAESGISTFRGREGIWSKYSPSIYATISGLLFTLIVRPRIVISFIEDFTFPILKAKPNPGHYALTELEERGLLSAVITQNIDNLHQEAGSKNVIELHGNVYYFRCSRCGKRRKLSKEEIKGLIVKLKESHSRFGIFKRMKRLISSCECRGNLRPDIIFFGEMLSSEEMENAYHHLKDCRLLLAIGTSGMVQPAASLPKFAKERGARIVEVNREPSEITLISDYFLKGPATKILLQLLNL